MTTPRDPDRLIHAFLREGAEQLQDQVYDVVRAEIDQKRQRVVIGPWRVPPVSKLVPIGLGAAAVIAVLFLGSQFIGSPTSNVGGPVVEPSATAEQTASPSQSTRPSVSPSADLAVPPALSETYTSNRYGLSISYPTGWVTKPSTEPWTSGIPDFFRADGDVIHPPTSQGGLWIMVASQPLAGRGGEQWVAEALTELVSEDYCESTLGAAVEIGGAEGKRCTPSSAAVSAGDRGYVIMLYVSNDDPAAVANGEAWFDDIVATVQLQPENAVDVAPSATP